MATRKALVLVSGLFQELNSSSDKLDFAGNSTTDLSEGSNQYFTTSRARGSVSVTDSGGDGSLAYNSTSGVITYTGPSASEARAHFSVASGSGLSYNSSSGEFGTSAIPNSQLANDDITIGSTSVALGASQGTFTGLTSLASTTLISGVADAANSIKIVSGNIIFEGSSANDFETTLTVTNPTADRTITFPDAAGTVVLLGSLSVAAGSGLTYNSGTGQFGTSSIPNAQLANSTVTVGSTAVALGASATTFTGLASITSTAVVTNDSGFRIRNNSDNSKILAFDLASISGSTTRTLTVPDASDTLVLLAATQTLTNKTLTSPVLNTGISGSAFLDEDDMASNSATKLASQQSIKAYVDTQLTAEDLDITTDSGTIAIDLDSETLQLSGGTGIDTSATGNTVTVAVDSTIATESFATAIAVALG